MVFSTEEVEDIPAKVKEVTGGKMAYAVCPQLCRPASHCMPPTCVFGSRTHKARTHNVNFFNGCICHCLGVTIPFSQVGCAPQSACISGIVVPTAAQSRDAAKG